jgi:hypothetical protein
VIRCCQVGWPEVIEFLEGEQALDECVGTAHVRNRSVFQQPIGVPVLNGVGEGCCTVAVQLSRIYQARKVLYGMSWYFSIMCKTKNTNQ